jgi:hypothetical protein
MLSIIARLVDEEAKLAVPAAQVAPRADLYALGLTPYTAIRTLLAIEREFGVEFARHRLNRRTMATLASIAASLDEALSPVAVPRPA